MRNKRDFDLNPEHGRHVHSARSLQCDQREGPGESPGALPLLTLPSVQVTGLSRGARVCRRAELGRTLPFQLNQATISLRKNESFGGITTPSFQLDLSSIR